MAGTGNRQQPWAALLSQGFLGKQEVGTKVTVVPPSGVSGKAENAS